MILSKARCLTISRVGQNRHVSQISLQMPRLLALSPRWSALVAADKVITLDVLRGYLNCHYLAHLLLSGQTGVKSDYEVVLAESEQAVRVTVLKRLCDREGSESVVTGAVLCSATLVS